MSEVSLEKAGERDSPVSLPAAIADGDEHVKDSGSKQAKSCPVLPGEDNEVRVHAMPCVLITCICAQSHAHTTNTHTHTHIHIAVDWYNVCVHLLLSFIACGEGVQCVSGAAGAVLGRGRGSVALQRCHALPT